ncbi:hypothetical protein TGDOM2_205530 [Toxoplasma gondii GAB2-2007-GAL-DOM2]|uniref:Uncharacterized protein n=3 Tax=Toxoplasma gondii TaxID=5811 RepID=B9QF65_TOXGV|nr:hypothetical protein TGVEG_205530 [Toxoplasma gondii VEG]KFG33691.1 hypothetical protein TGP89_205530 [Toxoplasma gondii p89]KFG38246.1 hypothetical protein TGDOM2_205530 [Toxoplasma gondii GAB2-2007-GAL-DOM2]CEL73659.1 TPA: hypothetical protein BN1205_043740 [Toxoplasma gondii VEG]
MQKEPTVWRLSKADNGIQRCGDCICRKCQWSRNSKKLYAGVTAQRGEQVTGTPGYQLLRSRQSVSIIVIRSWTDEQATGAFLRQTQKKALHRLPVVLAARQYLSAPNLSERVIVGRGEAGKGVFWSLFSCIFVFCHAESVSRKTPAKT